MAARRGEGRLWWPLVPKLDVCPGGRLDLMLHSGGHGVPEGWLTRALDWFEERLVEG